MSNGFSSAEAPARSSVRAAVMEVNFISIDEDVCRGSVLLHDRVWKQSGPMSQTWRFRKVGHGGACGGGPAQGSKFT